MYSIKVMHLNPDAKVRERRSGVCECKHRFGVCLLYLLNHVLFRAFGNAISGDLGLTFQEAISVFDMT